MAMLSIILSFDAIRQVTHTMSVSHGNSTLTICSPPTILSFSLFHYLILFLQEVSKTSPITSVYIGKNKFPVQDVFPLRHSIEA